MKLEKWVWKETAEVLGVIGIIAGIGFLGFGIRQNTTAVRSATRQAVSDQAMELTLSMATDEHLPRLVNEMENGVTARDLDPVDIFRLRLVVTAGLRRQENLYLQVQAGVLDPSALSNVSFGFYNNAFVREHWGINRGYFNVDFARYWDDVLAERWLAATSPLKSFCFLES